jgi:glycosyltransferase involved in cell wall biosynthesis
MNYGLKIGIDVSRANSDIKTGVEWYTWHVIQELKKISAQGGSANGWKTEDTQFVLYSKEPLKGELSELPPNWESKVLSWAPNRLWTQIRLSWEMLVNPPDVLFIPAHVFPIIHPKKTVMTIHDVAAIKFPESYNWFERWYSVWAARVALIKLWKVIVPSQFVKDQLTLDFGLRTLDKIQVVSHGYDKRYKAINSNVVINNVLKRYNITKPFILSIGRYEEKKNTTRIIKAFDQLSYNLKPKTYNLVLVGKPGHGYNKVQEAYENSPNKDHIVMSGYVAPEDLVYIMNAAEVFVFPSMYEGFGLPVLEAMACGIAVVVATGSSLEEVGGECCEYVDPMSIEDITRGIEKVIRNEEIQKYRNERGLERVKNFSWEKCAEETLGVFFDL